MNRRNSIYVRVLLVVLALVVFLVLTNKAPRHAHHDTWMPSSYNSVGAGSMALYQTLEDLHWPVARWREPLSRLPEGGSLLIVTRSPVAETVAFSAQEIDLLDAWVRRGNTLVLLGALAQWDDTRALLEQAGFTLLAHNENVGDILSSLSRRAPEDVIAQPTPAAGTTGALRLPRAEPFPGGLPDHAVVLWQNQNRPYVLDVPRGHGHIVCALSDRLLSNASLQQGDNVAAVLALLAPSGKVPAQVLFEESHHGYSSVYALVRLLEDSGVRFAGMLVLLGGLAFFGSSLVRFGPVVPLYRGGGRSTLEFVDSIADLYVRADVRDDTIRYLFHETHQQLLERLHLPDTATHEMIAARLQLAHPHLPKWKKLAHRFNTTDYIQGLPPSGWLHVAQDLIQIKTALT
jgi:hypothetical protein